MRVLVACEFSQIVTKAFRDKGHEAYSCDILPTEGNPDWHIQDDVLKHLDEGWDLMIAHPPCQYLTYAGLAHWKQKGRAKKRNEAMKFFKHLYYSQIRQICIENPMGYPNTVFRSSDQTIHPYYFGDPHVKRTCLWLKNLPKLIYPINIKKPKPLTTHIRRKTKNFKGGEIKNNYYCHIEHRQKERSRFWPGIAKAMADQWSDLGPYR